MAESTIKPECFLSETDVREYLRKPFVYSGNEIRTNGHVILIKKTSEPDNIPSALNEGTIKTVLADIESKKDFEPMPFPDLDFRPCGTCCGNKTVSRYDCPDCEGEGEVEWQAGSYTYHADCRGCDGDGYIIEPIGTAPCSDCNGTGQVYKSFSVKIGGSNFQTKYVSLIAHPDTTIAKPKENEMLVFQHGDYKGAIMCCRV